MLVPPPPLKASEDYKSRPGTVAHTRSLPDNSQVVLDSMIVTRVSGPWIFVKDSWSGTDKLLVLAHVDIPKWSSVEITGYTRTIQGHQIVVATRVRLYVCANGRPFIMMPKGRQPIDWPFMRDLSLIQGMSILDLPPMPEEEEPVNPPATVLSEGTIGWAKSEAKTDITVSGKIVTALFYESNTRNVDYFYIEEPDRSSGIKVDADDLPSGTVIDIGDVVSVTGDSTQTTPDAEAYIDATSVEVTGVSPLPKPLGLPQKGAVGAQFGIQAALHGDPTIATSHAGMNAAGLRVRIWGTVTYRSQDMTWCLIDDGSGLNPIVNSNPPVRGMKVVFATTCPYAENDYVAGINGILGGETVTVVVENVEVQVPIPVLRIPNYTALRVKTGTSSTPIDGSSWEHAYNSLQTAIDAAAPNQAEVWVAAGTYTGNFTLADGVAVYGGFAGTEESRDQRNPTANETILYANSGSIVTASSDIGIGTRIDGFTIQNGKDSGIYCYGASPCIINNNINNNEGYYGGGIACCSDSAPEIRGNTISGNLSGGGIFSCDSSPVIIANHITDNTGGGILCYSFGYGVPIIRGNYITENEASDGGGIYLYQIQEGVSDIVNNVISGNTASGSGGGISALYSFANITNNTIVDNTATDAGGLYLYGYSAYTLVNNIIATNTTGIDTTAGCSPVVLYNNCVHGNGSSPADDYLGLDPGATDIRSDPDFDTDGFHLLSGSPCRDAANDAFMPAAPDIDGHPRKQGMHLDIGADESEYVACCETITVDPVKEYDALNSQIEVTSRVFNTVLGRPVTNRQVNFTITEGAIVSITGDTNYVGTPPTSGYGTTDDNGEVTATITSSDLAKVDLTASTATSCPETISANSELHFGTYQIGFAYSLCHQDLRSYFAAYLAQIAYRYPDTAYSAISDLTSITGYNVIFLILPTRPFTPSEISALSTFVESGRQKRVVLIGEFPENIIGGNWRSQNTWLNSVATSLGTTGMTCQLDDITTTPPSIDNGYYECEVNHNHYLMDGVMSLYDCHTGVFKTLGDANELAYTADTDEPWAAEEDILSAGSRIVVHDSYLLYMDGGNIQDIWPDPCHNFRFVYNLCTVFRP